MPRILVIDDEESVRYSFRYVFEGDDMEVLTAGTAGEGLQLLLEQHPDVVLLDLKLPDRSGLDLYSQIRTVDPKRPVIFITAHGTTETAIEAMKQGAFDYLVKPVDLDRLSQILSRALEAARLMHVPALLTGEEASDRIVGRSPNMQEMCKTIGRIAPLDVNVLILGESGTGKELVARALYHHSKRASQPFMAINCAAIPEALLESELFGHEQGAFTGAYRRRIGKFEQCNGGTLFLDEIGDMSPALQAKMLRVLQDQQFERLGGNETLQTDVRLLAATNQDLEKRVGEERFRKDLYYRLKGVTIRVPPLRERLEDVAELAHYFLYRFNRELDRDLRAIAPETLDLFQSHSWPGNVRELQGVIRETMLRSSGSVLLPEFLPQELRPTTGVPVPVLPASSFDLHGLIRQLLAEGATDVYARVIESVERILFPEVLAHVQMHQARASELLGMSRGTLRTRLRALRLGIDKIVIDDPSTGDG
jgi:two-component system nitrogen regulation response regulator GlnG